MVLKSIAQMNTDLSTLDSTVGAFFLTDGIEKVSKERTDLVLERIQDVIDKLGDLENTLGSATSNIASMQETLADHEQRIVALEPK